MTRNTLPTEVLEAIEAAGFSAFMRDRNDSWCVYTDGENIGYLQNAFFTGYDISTKHKPNKTTGTGWQMIARTFDLSPANLAAGFKHCPGNATSKERESIRKYAGIEEYRAESKFNADLERVSAADDRAERDHAANDLALFVINDGDIYRRHTLPALKGNSVLHPSGEPMAKIMRAALASWAKAFGDDDPQLVKFRRNDIREQAIAQIIDHYADHEA